MQAMVQPRPTDICNENCLGSTDLYSSTRIPEHYQQPEGNRWYSREAESHEEVASATPLLHAMKLRRNPESRPHPPAQSKIGGDRGICLPLFAKDASS